MRTSHSLLTQRVTRRSALAAGLAVAAGLPFTTRSARAADGQTIRIALVKATVCAPSLVIQQFLPTGWKTELTPFTSPGDMTNALLTDSMDVAYTGLTVGIVARSREQPIEFGLGDQDDLPEVDGPDPTEADRVVKAGLRDAGQRRRTRLESPELAVHHAVGIHIAARDDECALRSGGR